MPPKKDKTILIKVCILNKQYSSINYSIRVKEGNDIEKGVIKFLKDNEII